MPGATKAEFGPARRVRIVCRCGRKIGQGPPWEYQHNGNPGGLWLEFQCQCGESWRPNRQTFTRVVLARLREQHGSRRVIRLPL